MRRIDLNVDIGEGFPYDEELLTYATSANVCCGEHAGSWDLTLETVALCRRRGVRIGAHPGFPDRPSMGRRAPRFVELDAWLASASQQATRLAQAANVAYVKPHGAFYEIWGAHGSDPRVGEAIFQSAISICRRLGVPLMSIGSSASGPLNKRLPVKLIKEGFADRAYGKDGLLVPRATPGAVIVSPDDAARQAVQLAQSVDSICVHGDGPSCVEMAARVREELEKAGYEVGA